MIKLPIYQVDAFTDTLFKGNYAAVVPLTDWLADELMQSIASENNLSETAFIKQNGESDFDIRWLSPLTEMDFCGHATLAAAFVVFQEKQNIDELIFHTRKVGALTIKRKENGLFEMSFPLRTPQPITEIPQALFDGLSVRPKEVLRNQQAYFAIYDHAAQIKAIVSDSKQLKLLAPFDVVVTAANENVADDGIDFVSRFFWPANGGDEDPVTGSTHAALAPFWAARLNKQKMKAYQASQRGGTLYCEVLADRVLVSGQAVMYLEGTIYVDL